MSLNEKIELIKINQTAAIAAINSYLDSIYNITEKYFEEDSLKESLTPDKKMEDFFLSIKNDAKKFEEIREKILKKNFDLSLIEINQIAICFKYVVGVWIEQIKNLEAAQQEANNLISKLVSHSEET